jgi:transcriptional/translational regulatory protein YebC/TACO1
VAIADDKLKSFLKLIDLLEDNDDVQNVWHNGEYDEPEE